MADTPNFPAEPAVTNEKRSIKRPACECYDKAEIFAALGDLSSEDIKQLQGFARFRLMGTAARPGYVEAEDLFMDAAIRTLKVQRCWPRGVGAFNHFFAVMRSINHHRLRQADRYVPLSESIAVSPGCDPSALQAQESVARLKERLRGDAIALNILECMMDEMRSCQIQLYLGISAKVYSAARKRIRRRAENLPGYSPKRRRGPKRPSPQRTRAEEKSRVA